MRILIADDEESNLVVLERVLQRAGYEQVMVTDDPGKVAELHQSFKPDLMVLDFHMPGMNGLQVMERLRPLLPPDGYFPILMLTADARPELKQKALASGAKDFLNKPINAAEVRLRIHNLLEARHFHVQLQAQNMQLEQKVKERTLQLEEAQIEMLVRLAKAAEFRDDESGEHIWRVASISALLARELGLPPERAELLLRACRLHDVGKIAVPDGILLRPGRLTPEEFEVVKTHTTVGAQLLSGGRSELMKVAELIALTHHERWDGSGYPRGLKGQEIPLESRIVAVADTFDALTHDRVHQRAWPLPRVVAEIEAQRGRQFDPDVVDAFFNLYERGELAGAPEAA